MADVINLNVLTPLGVSLEEKVRYVNIPMKDGSVGILAGHAPMLCAVSEGALKYSYTNGEEKLLKVGSGVANVANNTVTVLVDKVKMEKE